MNTDLLLLLDEQQPLVGVMLDLPARLFGILIRPIARREKSPQIDLVPGVDILLLANSFAIDRAEVGRPAGAAVHLGIRREHVQKADAADRYDVRTQPSFML